MSQDTTIPNVISLGAGVQSSTMALMAAHGELTPMPSFAVFADTQHEPEGVYTWLDWLEDKLPFPVYRVTAGDLREQALKMKTTKDGRKFSTTAIPVFTLNEDGSKGRVPHRTCTRDYKLRPIYKELRKRCGIRRGQKEVGVVQWIGISLDEMKRMRTSRDPWAELRYPLIEKRISRGMCLDWMQEHGYPTPPRSACVFCPFHGREEWQRLKEEEPEEFAAAVEFEKELQRAKGATDTFHSVPYLHRSCVPLEEIDLRSDYERGQLPLWDDECTGMCGV